MALQARPLLQQSTMSTHKMDVEYGSGKSDNGHDLQATDTNDTIAPEIIGKFVFDVASNETVTS